MRLSSTWPGCMSAHGSGLVFAALVVVMGCTTEEPGPVASSSGVTGTMTSSADGSSTASTNAASTAAVDSTGSIGCGEIVGEGFAVGQISNNWTLQDASGADVSLYDYCGNVIYLEIGAEW